jgi:lactate dehydrogenase-like 2-hydroxyacid dehydrogenase
VSAVPQKPSGPDEEPSQALGEHRVYASRRLTPDAADRLTRSGVRFTCHDEPMFPPDRDRLLAEVKGCSALVTMLTERVDGELLDAAGPGLRVVANVAVGYDNVDLDATRERSIQVTNTPGVLDGATADFTMALLLAASRRLVEADRLVRGGTPWQWGPTVLTGLDLSAGASLGIVGLGRIGLAVARRAHAFGMTLLASGGKVHSPEARELGVVPVELDELLERADVVSLHCPLTPSTRGMIGATELARMKRSAILINTARGALVDEEALAHALSEGLIGGAGLDVFANEPSVPEALRSLDNVVLAPHVGSAGDATRERMCDLAVGNVLAVLTGRPALSPVAP